MSRHDVTDEEWNAIRVLLPKQRSGRRGRPWADHRRTISGIFWILATGCPWRDCRKSSERGKQFSNDFDGGAGQDFGKRFGAN